jgi:hypothetical protein
VGLRAWRNILRARLVRRIPVDGRDAVRRPKTVVLVGILKEEDAFVDEWIAYHRLLGVEHFYLYDHDPRLPLKRLLHRHRHYVTVTDWLVRHGVHARHQGFSAQVKAYNHYRRHYAKYDQWAAFIDADEFIALKKHASLQEFLREYDDCCAVSLNWFAFGHNGFYENPEGLIVESLTRRRREASRAMKTICKNACVKDFINPHYPILADGCRRVDGNRRPLSTPLQGDDAHAYNLHYEGIGDTACIHHYWCRSFQTFMRRPKRGSVDGLKGKSFWQTSEEACLERFVTVIAKTDNEVEDLTLARHAPAIRRYLSGLGNPGDLEPSPQAEGAALSQ